MDLLSSIGKLKINRESFEYKVSPAADFKIDKLTMIPGRKKPKNFLGKGQYGEVWKGTVLNQNVAVKKLHPHDNGNENAALDELMREAQFLTHNTCNEIVLIVRICLEPGSLMIATELLDGDLESWVEQTNVSRVHVAEKMRLMIDCIRGINFLHHNDIIHYDVKPQNIFIDSKAWRAKIGDLGLAVFKNEKIDGVGTPLFSAPEVLINEEVIGDDRKKADVFSLACTIAWVVNNGERLYPRDLVVTYSDLVKHICDSGIRPEIKRDIPASLESLLERSWDEKLVNRIDSDTMLDEMLSVIYDCYFPDEVSRAWWKSKFIHGDSKEVVSTVKWEDFSRAMTDISVIELSRNAHRNLRKYMSRHGVVDAKKLAYVVEILGPLPLVCTNLKSIWKQPYFRDGKDSMLNNEPRGTYFMRDGKNPGQWVFVVKDKDDKFAKLLVKYKPSSRKWYAGTKESEYKSLESAVRANKERYNWTRALIIDPERSDPNSTYY